jgi:hypothetical protein
MLLICIGEEYILIDDLQYYGMKNRLHIRYKLDSDQLTLACSDNRKRASGASNFTARNGVQTVVRLVALHSILIQPLSILLSVAQTTSDTDTYKKSQLLLQNPKSMDVNFRSCYDS